MSYSLRLALLAGGAALGVSAFVAAANPRAVPEQRYFDPVLSRDPALCLSDRQDRLGLMKFYQKLAQTELRPFPTQREGAASPAGEAADIPLWDNLGNLSQTITTANPQAQRYFDQGLRLSFAFNHAEARLAFRKAQELDPQCAMCYWGEALVLGPNINAPMAAEANEPALAAVRKAEALAKGASEKERALIEALTKRYSADPKAQRASLDAAYAGAMGQAAARVPEDDNIQVLYAEALMDLTPWDYWEAGGAKAKGKTADILSILEKVLAKHPDHPGAIHFYIHMVEASTAPERALPHAKRLAAVMPGAGHLVHMPFHIYFRIGEYKEAIEANRAAVAADEAYIAKAAPKGIYPQAYYPHNVHSLMVSAQMAGDGKTAVEAAEKLARIVTEDASRAIPWVQPIQLAPYFAHAQFSDAKTVLALPDPGDGLPYIKAMWHYARGVAYAAQGDLQAALREAGAMQRIREAADFAGLIEGGVPAPQVLELARQIVLGRIAQAGGKLEEAKSAFEQAVAIQDELSYTEPPHWYYPVRQSLGAVLMRLGEFDKAEEVFRASLARAPNNGWALYGLGELYKRTGKTEAAAEAMRLLDKAWVGERTVLDFARL